MARSTKHRSRETRSLLGSGKSGWVMSRESSDNWNLFGLQFVNLWLIGVAIFSAIQVAANISVRAEIYIALLGAALLINTLASASQKGNIWKDQQDGLEYTSASKTIWRLGFLNFIWLNVILIGIAFLYKYTEGYHHERIEQVVRGTDRNTDQQLYLLFIIALMFTGLTSSVNFCATGRANSK
jgi:hypothetical protein